MELFLEQGFDETAVVEIAARAGVTERTFFRYFADKREALFTGTPILAGAVADAAAEATPDSPPITVVLAALKTAAREVIEPRAVYARRRAYIIRTHPDLHERELLKLTQLADVLRTTLQARDVDEAAAAVAADVGIAVFSGAFYRWAEAAGGPDLPALIDETYADLRKLIC